MKQAEMSVSGSSKTQPLRGEHLISLDNNSSHMLRAYVADLGDCLDATSGLYRLANSEIEAGRAGRVPTHEDVKVKASMDAMKHLLWRLQETMNDLDVLVEMASAGAASREH